MMMGLTSTVSICRSCACNDVPVPSMPFLGAQGSDVARTDKKSTVPGYGQVQGPDEGQVPLGAWVRGVNLQVQVRGLSSRLVGAIRR